MKTPCALVFCALMSVSLPCAAGVTPSTVEEFAKAFTRPNVSGSEEQSGFWDSIRDKVIDPYGNGSEQWEGEARCLREFPFAFNPFREQTSMSFAVVKGLEITPAQIKAFALTTEGEVRRVLVAVDTKPIFNLLIRLNPPSARSDFMGGYWLIIRQPVITFRKEDFGRPYRPDEIGFLGEIISVCSYGELNACRSCLYQTYKRGGAPDERVDFHAIDPRKLFEMAPSP